MKVPTHQVVTHLFCLTMILLACQSTVPLAAQEEIDVAVVEETWQTLPNDFTLRARVTRITPREPTDILWRHSGEGLGGRVIKGKLGEKLQIGQWSAAIPVGSLKKGNFPKRLFLTFTVGRPGRPRSDTDRTKVGSSTDVEMEIEFSYKGRALKTLKEVGPDGGAITIHIPGYALGGGKTPDAPGFLNDLIGIHEYAVRRAERLEKLPWASWPVPKRYLIICDLKGYGKGSGYGVRHTNLATLEAEARSIRQLGANGIRRPLPVVEDMVVSGKGFAKDFNRGMFIHVAGFPAPTYRADRPSIRGAGCAYYPTVLKRTEEGIARSMKILEKRVPEVWGLTIDEIGPIANRALYQKQHLSACPYCAEGFRKYLADLKLTPQDFGKQDWSEVKPLDIFGPPRRRKGKTPPALPSDKPWEMPDVTDEHTALAAYYTARFNNYASAKLFTPLCDAFDRANEAKRAALERGETDAPAAKQPWVYSYALRANTFLMKGASLDFFNFYRLADNAFMYETSNRGARVWQWDSYLCDVGRILSEKMNKRFGIDLKPHRGAPVQRALSAVSRNCKVIYWYTYGPDYAKGDSFSQNPEDLKLVSKAARLIGKTEHVLYNSSWSKPAEVAVVKPRTSEIWRRLNKGAPQWLAAWENAKWIYTALAHAHIPVDPLDEEMLATENLSRYKIIYVNGPSVTKAAAKALKEYVKAGGTLYTSGWGLVRDEANRPLKVLEPVLGLEGRNDPEMYYTVALYGATKIASYSDPKKLIAPVPDGAKIIGTGALKGRFKPVIGREVLKPAKGTEVLARFADGKPAVTRRAYGKGQAYVVGFFPGLEYSAPTRTDRFNMARDFHADRRSFVTAPALAVTTPPVDPAQPAVAGLLSKNDATGKQAVTLMNWAYRVTAHRKTSRGLRVVTGIVRFKNLKVTIRGAGDVKKVVSAMLDRPLPIKKTGDLLVVTLPRLDEGDVLLLE